MSSAITPRLLFGLLMGAQVIALSVCKLVTSLVIGALAIRFMWKPFYRLLSCDSSGHS